MSLLEANDFSFLKGGGEMGEMIRSKDWSSTAIGTSDNWPQSLRIAVSIILNSRFPMFIWWGPQLITFYNDAYRSIAGEKHPKALGEPGLKVWSEIWDVVGPLADEVMVQGVSNFAEDQLLYINRHGYVEETYFTFSYSPVFYETGTIGGVFCACTETTEKVFAARKAEESERNLRNMILQSPVAMCILRGDTFIVETANARMFELWGRSAEELTNKPIFAGLPEAAHKGLEELLLHVYKTGETYYGNEVPVAVPRNGKPETVYVNFVYDAFREANRSITGVMAVAIEVTAQVTARKKMEESETELQRRVEERTAELKQQKMLLDNIMKYSPAGITVTEFIRGENGEITDGKTIMANAISEEYTEILIENFQKNKTAQDNSDILHNRFVKKELHALKSGQPFITQYYLKAIEKWLEVSVARMDENRLINIFTDITIQKKAQLELEKAAERIVAVFNTSQSGMFTFAPEKNEQGEIIDFRFVITNPAFAAYVGQKPETLNGALGSTWFPGYLHNGVFDMYKKTYLTGESQRIDIRYNVDQHDIYLDLKSSKIGDEVFVTFTDYTPLKKAQLQLEKYVEDLKFSNANLEEFAYAASHDLKEPVRKIQIFSARLNERLKEKLDKENKMYFERLQNAAGRMSTLIDDLLEYSQISNGNNFLQEVNLTKILDQVLEDLELEIEEKKAFVSADLLPVIKGHGRQLQQLFQNLITNALKFSKPGITPQIRICCRTVPGKEVSLSLPQEARNQQYFLIEITDNGIGFEPQNSEKIFKMFQRLHGKTEYAGTGIGLSIVRKVVQNHGGYIWAVSLPDEGASFKILLPVN